MPITYPGVSAKNAKFALLSGIFDYASVAVPTDETLSSVKVRQHRLQAEGESLFPAPAVQSALSIAGEKPVYHRVCTIDGEVKFSYDKYQGAIRRNVGDKVPGHQGSALVLETDHSAFLPQSYTSYQAVSGTWYNYYEYQIDGSDQSGSFEMTQYEHYHGKISRGMHVKKSWTINPDNPKEIKIVDDTEYSPGGTSYHKEYTGSVSYVTVPVGIGYTFDQFIAMLEEDTLDLRLTILSLRMNIASWTSSGTAAAVKAIEPLRATSLNNIENAAQTIDGVKRFFKFADVVKNTSPNLLGTHYAALANLPSLAAKVAEGYLTYRYAVKPTIGDLRELGTYVKQQLDTASKQMQSGQSVFRASESTEKLGFKVEARSKVQVDSPIRDDVDKIMNQIDALGLEPSLQRGWDLVPYSFVLDWFTNIGDMLTAIDVNSASHRFPIRCVTTSVKVTAPSEKLRESLSSNLIRIRDVRLETYKRSVSTKIPPLPDIDLRGFGRGGHAIAGSALIITSLD